MATAVLRDATTQASPEPSRGGDAGPPVETRKLQLVGGATFAVSLPKAWVQAVGLHVGDEVTVQGRPDGSLLVVARSAAPRHRERELAVDGLDADFLLRMLIACYVAGTDVVVLRAKGPVPEAARVAAQQACERLLGLQVVDEGASALTLQDVAETRNFNVPKAVRVMHLHARRMLQLAGAPPTEQGRAELQRSEAELDRLLLFLLKQHNLLMRDLAFGASTGIRAEDSLAYLLVAQGLERVGDYALRIAGRPEGARAEAELAARSAQAAQCIDAAMTAFYRQDARLAHDAILATRALAHVPAASTDGACGGCLVTLSNAEHFERVGLYAKSIAEVAMNHAAGQAARGSGA